MKMGYLLIGIGILLTVMGVIMVTRPEKTNSEVQTAPQLAEPSASQTSYVAAETTYSNDKMTDDNVIPSVQPRDSKEEGQADKLPEAKQEMTSKEKGNAFESSVADVLKGCGIRIKQWNQGTLTEAGAMGENALNPDFFVEQPYGNSSIEYWLECKWRKNINGKFTFPESQFERYKKVQHDSKRKVLVVFGIGGQPSKAASVFIIPIDKIKDYSVSLEDLRPYYYSDPATQLMPRISKYFKEEVFKKKK